MPKPPSTLFLITLVAITMIGPLSLHLFLPALPLVKDSFGISDGLAQFTFSIALFTMAVTTLIYGALSDRYGRRPVLLGGLSLFVIGVALAALAPSVEWFIAGRLIQAIGAGCGVALARAIARDAYGPEFLVKAIAYLTMAYTLGPMISPPVGGILVDAFGWRSIFWFALIIGGIILIGATIVLHETRPIVLHTGKAPGMMRGFARLLRQPLFMAFVLQSGFSSGTFFGLASAATFMMKDYLGRPATEFGIYFLMFPIGYFLGNWASSRLSGRVRIEHMVLAGSAMLAAVIAGMVGVILLIALTPLVIFLAGGLISFSQGIALPNAQAGAIRVIPELAGTAAGIGVFLQMFCGGVFSQLYGVFSDGTPAPMLLIVSVAASLTLLCGIAAFALSKAPTKAA
jgi:DHA1 family bicyclomycin/chloramphenicol resistance-like MFS transporter